MNIETLELNAVAEVAKNDDAFELLALLDGRSGPGWWRPFAVGALV